MNQTSQILSKRDLAFFQYRKEALNYFVTDFMVNDKMEEAIKKALSVIFNLDETFSNKGLILFSKSYGQGKTLFFEIVSNRALRVTKQKLWTYTSAKDLRALYAKKGIAEIDKFILCKNLFIDDLGEEEETGKSFGDEMNVLRYVILKRYEMYMNTGAKLHLTTNLTIGEIADKYDAKVADRLLGMTEIIEFDFITGSFRQTKKARRLLDNEKKKPKEKRVVVEFDNEAFCVFLNVLVDEFQIDNNLMHIHWTDFLNAYNFFRRKGVNLREPTNEDRLLANNVIKIDRKNNETKRISLKEAKQKLKVNLPFQLEDAVLSVIAKEYFIKLAKLKYKFCETDNLPEM